MVVTASAPGKLMLLGDHAVVYDHPCIVTAVDLRYSVSIEVTNNDEIKIKVPVHGIENNFSVKVEKIGTSNTKETSFVEAAISAIYKKYGVTKGLAVTTNGPKISYGLGSSSAVTVATVRALSQVFNLNLTSKEIFELSYQAVLDVQGKGSGFDVAAAVFGGTIYYAGKGKHIEPLQHEDIPLVICYSGEKVGTVNLVKQVYELKQRRPNIVDSVFEIMHRLVDRAREALLNSDWDTVGELANIHQGLLDALGVNAPKLSELVFSARKGGALGAKLSGAGGGDCIFALYSGNNKDMISSSLLKANGEIIDIKTGARGVYIASVS